MVARSPPGSAIATQWPHDILAFRMHHLLGFWCGRPELLFTCPETTLSHYGRELPPMARCWPAARFAYEESRRLSIAENCAREAIAIDASDVSPGHPCPCR